MASDTTTLGEMAAILAQGYLRLEIKTLGEPPEIPPKNSQNLAGIALSGGAENGFMGGRKVKTD